MYIIQYIVVYSACTWSRVWPGIGDRAGPPLCRCCPHTGVGSSQPGSCASASPPPLLSVTTPGLPVTIKVTTGQNYNISHTVPTLTGTCIHSFIAEGDDNKEIAKKTVN